MGKALGVRRTINSPTFNIIHHYTGVKIENCIIWIVIAEDSDEDLGFDEFFEDQAITVLNRSRFIKDLLPSTHLLIFQQYLKIQRQIELFAQGEHYERI
ncbi:tRNA (adenosine(37)-N6)-threonylcarbamoyltransferase complex ATPase subunit type 1 TsaE [Staphylococcus aureus]